ncbi:hypothetical protein [Microvirga sp. KLBC 81]|nr:hypothetical protein [Microvirga sp. KLBC 81]
MNLTRSHIEKLARCGHLGETAYRDLKTIVETPPPELAARP